MVFAFNLFFSLLYSYAFAHLSIPTTKYKQLFYIIGLLPIVFLWLFITGGQYKVGTDYETYYNTFSTANVEMYYYKCEYLFAWIVESCSYLSLHPQIPFFIFYALGIVFFIKILTRLEHSKVFLFILLYISVSTVFNNQLNGLRQYTAIYICSYSLFVLTEKNGVLKFLFYTLLASLIHSSSVIILPFLVFKYFPTFNFNQGLIFLTLSVLFSFLGGANFIISCVFDFLPRYYQNYIGGDYDISLGILKLLPKLVFLPFYFLALFSFKTHNSTSHEIYLFKIGFIGYCIRLIFLNNSIFNRIGYTFLLVSLYPLYFLMKNLLDDRKYLCFLLISLFFISFYLLKVLIFPRQEYLYDSIYFKNL